MLLYYFSRLKFIALALLLSLGACASSGPIQAITAERLSTQITANTAPLIIDTRTGYEYRKGHIPGAVNIPFQQSWLEIAELRAKKDQLIVVYCAHGPRASFAASRMSKAGFKHILHLQGDMSGWRKQGRQIER